MISFNPLKNELLFQERQCPSFRVTPRHRLVCPHCNRLLEAELGTDLSAESGLPTATAVSRYDWSRRWAHYAVGGGMVLQNLSHTDWVVGMDGQRLLACREGGLYVGGSFAAAYAEIWAEVCRAFATVERVMGRARTDLLKKGEIPDWVVEHFGKPLDCGTSASHRPPEVLTLPKIAQLTGVTTLVSASGGRTGMLVNPLLFSDRLRLRMETGDPFTPERLVLALGGLGRTRPAQRTLPPGLVVQPLAAYMPLLPAPPCVVGLEAAGPAVASANTDVTSITHHSSAGPTAADGEPTAPAPPRRRGAGKARRLEMSDLYVSLSRSGGRHAGEDSVERPLSRFPPHGHP